MPGVGLTRAALVAAAADLADEVGFDRLTLSTLAARFGVRSASLYTHIRHQNDLREAVARLAHDEWADLLADALAGRSGRTALRAFADAYRNFATGHPGRYAATRLPVDGPGAVRVMELCTALLRGYDLSETDSIDAVRLLRSTFHGFSDIEATSGFTAGRDPDASWRRAVDALHDCLTRWPPTPPTDPTTGDER